MATKHAKVLDEHLFAKLLYSVSNSEHRERDTVIILLSYKAGLRAAEIAGLDWEDVTDAAGLVRSDHLFVPSDIAKKARERTVPMNPHLQTALLQLRMKRPNDRCVAYGIGRGNERMSSVGIRVWFARLYKSLELQGCSSHSGRRTFITRLARKAGAYDCSIEDVRLLAGHAHASTTHLYIEPSPHVGRLVAAI